VATLALLGALVPAIAAATVPDLIPIQGVLADDAGDPVDAPTDMTFSLYSVPTDGTALWTDTFVGVDVVDGFFTVYLGSGAALDFAALVANDELWMGITVGADPEMERFQLAAVPFAIEAQVCRAVGSLTEEEINANFAPAAHDHDGEYAPVSHTHAWTDLTGVPAGFADDVDDVDDTVAWSEISGIVGTTSTTVAAGNHNHDAAYVNEGQASSVTGGMITDGAIGTADLSSAAIGALKPLIVSTTTGATTYLTTSCANYSGGSVTITVPGPGTIWVTAQTWTLLEHTNGTEDNLIVAIGTTTVDCGSAYYQGRVELPSAYPTASSIDTTTFVHRPISVLAGGSYTYYLNGYMSSGYAASTDRFWFASMVAQFFPS
jgi:hypothetical protein